MWTKNSQDIQAGFRKCRGTRDQIANILLNHRKSKRIPEKNIYFCFIDYTKAFDCVDQNKLWKILKEMVIGYSEWCQILDLQSKFSVGTRDQARSLKSFCVAEFY